MKHYLALAVRVLAIALFLYGIQTSGQFIQLFFMDYSQALKPNLIFSFLSFVIPLLLAVIFWTFPKLITKKI